MKGREIITKKSPIAEKRRLSVVQYNVLAQVYATPHRHTHIDKDRLKFPGRFDRVLDFIKESDADIVCLQEVDHYEDYFRPKLARLGYECIYNAIKTGLYGCLIAYKPKLLYLDHKICFNLRGKDNQVGIVGVFIYNQMPLHVLCTHLKADKTVKGEQIRKEQVDYLRKRIIAECGGRSVNWIISCDLNGCPRRSETWGEPLAYYAMMEENFISSYRSVLGNEPLYTTRKYRKDWKDDKEFLQSHTLDYIFSRGSLFCVQVLNLPELDIEKDETLPNEKHPSDHLPLLSVFAFLNI